MEVINQRFQLVCQVGKGCWSVVYKAYDPASNADVAIKLETGVEPEKSLLLREAKILKHLQGIAGVPLLIDQGTSGSYNYCTMELLEANLEELYNAKRLSSMDVMFKAEQLIDALEAIHAKKIVHQDLKPKNLMTKDTKTFLVDFGLATKVKKVRKNAPRTKGMLGTPSFASLAALLGMSQFPKDDLEALGYVIIWLLRGALPWENYVSESNLSGLKTMKFHSTVRQICQDCPDEMVFYFNYIKGLKEFEKPDYEYLKSLMVAAHRKYTFNKLAASPLLEKRAGSRKRMKSSDLSIIVSSETVNYSSKSLVPSSPTHNKSSRHSSNESKLNSMKAADISSGDKSIIDLSICSIGDLQILRRAFDSNVDETHSCIEFPKIDDSPGVKSSDTGYDETKLTPRVNVKPSKLEDARRKSQRLKTIAELNALTPAEFSDSQRTNRLEFDASITQGRLKTFGNEYLETEESEDFPQMTGKLKIRLKTIVREKAPTPPEPEKKDV
eukprot:CAMPEP_0204911132 /NCGR_PEP_ID=MMETSP1397-20131031/9537_1 /ASSEMBLY_ACC=CAM_ASM_000891 /TAXON_ID=49980 /ORGANISM="Climacostomum Climacostomum virens, Strain Stock W-24" /LENGTH=497 /DNA_ID=CAMNT_0052081577 /DNA_START=1432 /DNA_END=2926 /DNA_ORIENTATION=-